MKILQNILYVMEELGFLPVRMNKPPAKQSGMRAFAAAAINRATSDWTSTRTTIDNDIRMGNPIVRERARDLEKNNDYAKGFIRGLRNNVVGPNGFMLQMNIKNPDGTPDKSANDMIEESWEDFSQKEHCSVDGQMSLRAIEDLLMIYTGRDGEGMLRPIARKQSKYGIQLQIIEPETIDERYSVRKDNGNVVKMGVEVDKWRRPINYYLLDTKPEYELYGFLQASYDHQIIPASEILHGYDRWYANQTRGVSWMVQSMIKMRMLTSYEEAAVINARVAASKMGFLVRKGFEGASYTGDDKDADGNIITSAEPASLEQLPAGMEFQPWDPQFPNQQHEMFMKSTLKGISTGLGMAYMSLTSDLAEANYSSMRAGLLPERDNYKRIQQWFIEMYLRPLFTRWLESAMLKGQIKFPSGKTLPFEKFDKFNKPVFIGRRWEWVDPLKDAQAHLMLRRAGFESPYDIAGEQGKDLEDIYSDIAEAEKLAKKYSITLSFDSKGTVVDNGEAMQNDKMPKKILDEAKELLASGNGIH